MAFRIGVPEMRSYVLDNGCSKPRIRSNPRGGVVIWNRTRHANSDSFVCRFRLSYANITVLYMQISPKLLALYCM